MDVEECCLQYRCPSQSSTSQNGKCRDGWFCNPSSQPLILWTNHHLYFDQQQTGVYSFLLQPVVAVTLTSSRWSCIFSGKHAMRWRSKRCLDSRAAVPQNNEIRIGIILSLIKWHLWIIKCEIHVQSLIHLRHIFLASFPCYMSQGKYIETACFCDFIMQRE